MTEIDSARLKIGEEIRDIYFRPESSDIRVIDQIFKDQDYDIRRLARFPEIARFVARSRASHRRPLIIDAGANIGASSLFLKAKSPDALVVAIEPDEGNYQLLAENIKGLEITPMHAAVASTNSRVQVIDVGSGFWGYQTRPLRDGEQGGIDTTTINEIYAGYNKTHFPYIVKIDIEGGEEALFSDNVEWVAKTPLIIIELHDWLLAGKSTSRPFLQCVANLDRDFIYVGENVFSIANDLDRLSASMGEDVSEMKSSLGANPRTKRKATIGSKGRNTVIGPAPDAAVQEIKAQSGVNATQEFEGDVVLLRHTKNELQEALAQAERQALELRQELANHQNLSDRETDNLRQSLAASQAALASWRDSAATSQELTTRLRQELASSLQSLYELKLENERTRVGLKDELSRLTTEAAQLRNMMTASDQKMLRLEQELASRLVELSELKTEREQLQSALTAAGAEAVQLRETAGASEQLVRGLRSETAVLQQRLRDQLANMARSRKDQSELQRMLRASNAAKEKLVRKFDESRAIFNRSILNLHEHIIRLDSEASALSIQLSELVRSTSWKISGPIRIAGRRLPQAARLSRRVLRPVWQLAYRMLGRGEPIIVRSSVSLESQPIVNASLAAIIQSDFELPAGELVQDDVLKAFESLQSDVERTVILIAADAPPMPDKHAGGLRLYNLVRMFCEMGWWVVFASQNTLDVSMRNAGSAEDLKRYERLLYDSGVEQITYGAEQGKILIRALGSKLRWAFLSFPVVAEHFIPQVRIHAPWTTIIYDMVDFHSLRMSRQAGLSSDAALHAEADRMRVIELTNARTADITVAVSESERQALLEIDPNLVVEVIPTVFEMPSDVRFEVDGRSGLLFVGGFWHTPNVDAVLWFARDVWPLILNQRPELRFCVAGSNPSEAILALRDQPGIDVVGYVPDLTDLFARSRMSVVPMRYGAGVKGKVGQSMAYGLPVVATSVGAEGMKLENGKHLLVADTPDEFVNAVIRLATDDDLWRHLQANGRRFVEQSQSMDVVRGKIRALMNG